MCWYLCSLRDLSQTGISIGRERERERGEREREERERERRERERKRERKIGREVVMDYTCMSSSTLM